MAATIEDEMVFETNKKNDQMAFIAKKKSEMAFAANIKLSKWLRGQEKKNEVTFEEKEWPM